MAFVSSSLLYYYKCFAIFASLMSVVKKMVSGETRIIFLMGRMCLSLIIILLVSCKKEKEDGASPKTDPLAIPYTVKTTWEHDTQAFTEGLLIHEGKLYESTGQQQSWIGIVDIKTGKPDKKVVLDNK